MRLLVSQGLGATCTPREELPLASTTWVPVSTAGSHLPPQRPTLAHALILGVLPMRRYICCNGDWPCSGRCSEQSCPEACLATEVCIAWGCALQFSSAPPPTPTRRCIAWVPCCSSCSNSPPSLLLFPGVIHADGVLLRPERGQHAVDAAGVWWGVAGGWGGWDPSTASSTLPDRSALKTLHQPAHFAPVGLACTGRACMHVPPTPTCLLPLR